MIMGKKRKKTSEEKKNNLLLLFIHDNLLGMLMSCAFIDEVQSQWFLNCPPQAMCQAMRHKIKEKLHFQQMPQR